MSQIKGLTRTLQFLRSQSLAQQGAMSDPSALLSVRCDSFLNLNFSHDYSYFVPHLYYRFQFLI